MTDFWSLGMTVLYREVWKGKVWTVRPVRVVQDEPDLLALYLAPNTPWKVPQEPRSLYFDYLLSGKWEMMDAIWPFETLFLIRPGEAHAVHVMWGKESRKFIGYYINLQEPIRRTPLGFDFMDQELDILVDPDLSWQWKDEAWFMEYYKAGRYTEEQVKTIRAEGERVIKQIEAKAPPFDSSWEHWSPLKEWSVPDLLEGWEGHMPIPSTEDNL